MLRYLIILIISSFVFTETVYRSIADKVALNINKQYNTSLNKSNYTIRNVDVIKDKETILIYAYHLNQLLFLEMEYY